MKKSNKLEVSDTAGASSTPETGGIHGNYVDYVVLQTNHHRHDPSLNALIRLLCVIFFVKLPSKNEVRRDRRGRGGSQQRHEPENQNS